MFRDEYEQLTGVPFGHNAFTVVKWPDVRPVEKSRRKRPNRSKKDLTLLALMSDEEKAAHKLAQKLARQNVSTFNTQIPDQAASDRTNSIKGKL